MTSTERSFPHAPSITKSAEEPQTWDTFPLSSGGKSGMLVRRTTATTDGSWETVRTRQTHTEQAAP
jgi:hypothetical protein